MLDDLLRPSFGNVTVPAQIFPCVDIDLNRGVAYRQFENIFPRRGDEVSRARVSLLQRDESLLGCARLRSAHAREFSLIGS